MSTRAWHTVELRGGPADGQQKAVTFAPNRLLEKVPGDRVTHVYVRTDERTEAGGYVIYRHGGQVATWVKGKGGKRG